MKIVFKNEDALLPLTKIVKVVNSKAALPVLSSILFTPKHNHVEITTSDGDTFLSMRLPHESCDITECFCVGAQDLLSALKNLGEVMVTMNVDKSTITCEYGCGKFTLPRTDAQEYPTPKMDIEDSTKRVTGGKKILRAIEKTKFAVASDVLRPVLNGVHFDFSSKGLVCAATDGHKLARYADNTVLGGVEGDSQLHLTLPIKPSNILSSILASLDEDITIMFNDRVALFYSPSFSLTTRLVEGKYPNYEMVIPKESTVSAIIDTASIASALRRVTPMSSIYSELVKLTFEGEKVTLVAEDVEFMKSAKEEIHCDFTGQPMTICFKGTSLMELLGNIEDNKVVMEMTDASHACVIYANDAMGKDKYLSLLMPMRAD